MRIHDYYLWLSVLTNRSMLGLSGKLSLYLRLWAMWELARDSVKLLLADGFSGILCVFLQSADQRGLNDFYNLSVSCCHMIWLHAPLSPLPSPLSLQ